MTTRSGLAIRKVSVTPMFAGAAKYSYMEETVARRQKPNYKTPSTQKRKSMNHLPFVTRFYLGLKIPDLDLCGNDSKDFDSRDDDTTQTSTSPTSKPGSDRLLLGDSDDEVFDSSTDDEFCDSIIAKSRDYEYQRMELEETETETEAPRNIADALPNLKPVIKIPDTKHSVHDTLVESLADSLENFRYPSPTQSVTAGISELSLSGPVTIMSTNPTPTLTAFTAPTVTTIRSGVIFQAKPAFTDLPPFKCEVCEKEFYVSANYTTHLRTHDAQTKNKCDVCGKVFTRSWLLKGHMRTHTGERPFVCPHKDCDKAFADKSNLRSHMLIHSVTSKNFSCQKCGRSFAQKRYLHKHLLEVCRVIQ